MARALAHFFSALQSPSSQTSPLWTPRVERTTKTSSCTVTMFCDPQPAARGPAFLMTLVSGIHQRKVGVLGQQEQKLPLSRREISRAHRFEGIELLWATCQHVCACVCENMWTCASGTDIPRLVPVYTRHAQGTCCKDAQATSQSQRREDPSCLKRP